MVDPESKLSVSNVLCVVQSFGYAFSEGIFQLTPECYDELRITCSAHQDDDEDDDVDQTIECPKCKQSEPAGTRYWLECGSSTCRARVHIACMDPPLSADARFFLR